MSTVTAQILDGKATLKAIKVELTQRVARLREQGVVPGLGTVLVGDDPGSHWYVNAKHKDCAEIGITSLRRDLPATATQAEVEAVIDELIAAAGVPGIVTKDMVKPGAAVLDVGVSRVDGKIAGDVALDVVDVAGFVAPNPGGVGPMTRAMLLQNVVLAAERSAALEALTA